MTPPYRYLGIIRVHISGGVSFPVEQKKLLYREKISHSVSFNEKKSLVYVITSIIYKLTYIGINGKNHRILAKNSSVGNHALPEAWSP